MADQKVGYILLTDHFPEYAHCEVYGLTFVERLIRQLREINCTEIIVWGKDQLMSFDNAKYCNYSDFVSVTNSFINASTTQIICAESDIIVDDRLMRHLTYVKKNTAIGAKRKLLCANGPALEKILQKNLITCYADVTDINSGLEVDIIEAKNVAAYIDDLRLNFTPYYFEYGSTVDLGDIQNHMYEANFKGTLDFIATYVYKYPVREITKFLSRHPWVTPDFITVLSIASSFAVPLLLAIGEMGWAVLVGWLMFIFDSVDGKLARLTVRLNPKMGVIEHATSAPAIFLWFTALGWHFSNGKLFEFTHPVSATAWSLMALYWLDKGVNGIFKPRFGIDLYNYAPIDRFFHLFACRRAIIHLIITIGWITGYQDEAFYFLGIWMVISFMFHLFRCGWILATDESQEVSDSIQKM